MKPEFFQAITQPTRLDTLPGHIIDSLIQLKGLSQAGQNCFSLATQARNFHSIPFFNSVKREYSSWNSLEDSVLQCPRKFLSFTDDDFNEFIRILVEAGCWIGARASENYSPCLVT